MPSTNKTPYLGLNKWQNTDKPKMSDFNADNQLVDDVIKQHKEDTVLHLTSAEKAYLDQPMTVGYYTGDGRETRDINLGFAPKFVLVFADSFPPVYWETGQNSNNTYCVMATPGCGSIGIDITAQGFRLYHTNAGVSDFSASRMNQNNLKYSYLAMK